MTATSGTTSSSVPLPQSLRAAAVGLGENYLRALLAGGVEPSDRQWGIQHLLPGAATVSGSSLTFKWVQRRAAGGALVTNTHDNLRQQLAAASGFGPTVVASAPGFLLRLADEAAGVIRPRTALFGGGALTDQAASVLRERLLVERIIGFYPTTDAGALAVSPTGDGIYHGFSESHYLEVVNDAGEHVQEGDRGTLLVTNFSNTATPIIRYKVGDDVQFLGYERNRLVLANIKRSGDAALGGTLLPLSDIEQWTKRLQQLNAAVRGAQLVRQSGDGGRDRPIIRIFIPSPADDAELHEAALNLLRENPQVATEVDTGELCCPGVEFVREPSAEGWKLRPYVDEVEQVQAPL